MMRKIHKFEYLLQEDFSRENTKIQNDKIYALSEAPLTLDDVKGHGIVELGYWVIGRKICLLKGEDAKFNAHLNLSYMYELYPSFEIVKVNYKEIFDYACEHFDTSVYAKKEIDDWREWIKKNRKELEDLDDSIEKIVKAKDIKKLHSTFNSSLTNILIGVYIKEKGLNALETKAHLDPSRIDVVYIDTDNITALNLVSTIHDFSSEKDPEPKPEEQLKAIDFKKLEKFMSATENDLPRSLFAKFADAGLVPTHPITLLIL